MIVHIVIWRLKDRGNTDIAAQVKQTLEALNGKIPELKHLEVGIDFNKSDAAGDVVLYSTFDSKEAMAAYQAHPEHQAVLPFMASVVSERRVVDYEI